MMEYKCESCGKEFSSDENNFIPCPACGKEYYRCHTCGKLTDDPHTNSEGEDVCEACCDVCKVTP